MTSRLMVLAGLLGLASCGATRPTCDLRSCPTGCCDSAGECQPGRTNTACGAGANTCRTCGLLETCTAGSCSGFTTGGGSAGGGSTAGGAAVGGGAASDGGLGGGSGGGAVDGGTGCASDSACSATETCHPVLRRCLPTCSGSSDCPDSQKTCATFTGLPPGNAAGLRAFCQCATDALCDRGAPGLLCQPLTKVCDFRCTAGSCPGGAPCDTATGKCGATVSDAGVPDAGSSCTFGACPGGRVCDPASEACIAPPRCSTANPQPDVCAYGFICAGVGCAEAPRTGLGCPNFANVVTPTLWNPVGLRSGAGPVTVDVANRTDDATFCASNAVPFSGRHQLYAAPLALGGTNFPAAGAMLPAGFINYVRSDGQVIDVQRPALFRSSGYVVSRDLKNLTLDFTLCLPAGTTSATAGFYAEGGNAVCVVLN